MAATINPRRRPAGNVSADNLADAFSGMSLQKGETLHAGNNTNTDLLDPLDPSSPLRSTTCPDSLAQLLISAGERRAADLLTRVDQAIATQSQLALANALNDPEVLPIQSRSAKENTSTAKEGDEEEDDDDTQTEVKTRTRSHSHSSDSGIGSSVDSITGKSAQPGRTAQCPVEGLNANNRATAEEINMATAERTLPIAEQRGLSEHAKDQIHKHIVKPILREQSLKEFHSLIKDVPRRIGDKEINTLRELERTLIFIAPVSPGPNVLDLWTSAYWRSGVQEYTSSPQKYLEFCERTVRVLHTTVTSLHESDQRAPTDRPYTQGYFVDLVEQVCLAFSQVLSNAFY